MRIKIKLNTIPQVRKFCLLSEEYSGEVYVQQGRYVVSGKSFMGMLSISLLEELILFTDEYSEDTEEYYKEIFELGIVVGKEE